MNNNTHLDIFEEAQASDNNAKNTKKKFAFTKKTKLIAGGAALVLILGIGGTYAYHQYTIDRDCQVQTELFSNQKPELTKAVKDAEAALALVEGDKPAAHTKGFTEIEGKTLTAEMKKAVAAVDKHTKNAAPKQCSTSDDLDTIKVLTSSRQADLDALTTQTTSFSAAVDAYRLKTASAEATSSMDTAKTNLAAAQKAAAEQLKIVDADTSLQSVPEIKTASDALKKLNDASHTLSTTINTNTYDDAVASIEKANAVTKAYKDIETSTQTLKDAINAHRQAKLAEAAAKQQAQQAQQAQRAQTQAPAQRYNSGNTGSNNYRSNNYRGTSTRQAPAPAPAPAPKPAPKSNQPAPKRTSTGDIDLSQYAQPNRPGCVYTEGIKMCS